MSGLPSPSAEPLCAWGSGSCTPSFAPFIQCPSVCCVVPLVHLRSLSSGVSSGCLIRSPGFGDGLHTSGSGACAQTALPTPGSRSNCTVLSCSPLQSTGALQALLPTHPRGLPFPVCLSPSSLQSKQPRSLAGLFLLPDPCPQFRYSPLLKYPLHPPLLLTPSASTSMRVIVSRSLLLLQCLPASLHTSTSLIPGSPPAPPLTLTE